MLKRKTSEQAHLNTKLFIPEPLRKIFASSTLLKKKSMLEYQRAMHTIILTQLQSESTLKSKPSTSKMVGTLPR